MCALRVAVQRRQAPNGRMECIEVVGSRQFVNVVERLNTFNFDLAQTMIRRIREGVLGGRVAVCGSRDLRCQAVPKRVHSRTRFAFLSAGAVAFGAIALVCYDLPLRCHGPYFPDADITPASWAPIALSVATRSTRALVSERFSRSFKYW